MARYRLTNGTCFLSLSLFFSSIYSPASHDSIHILDLFDLQFYRYSKLGLDIDSREALGRLCKDIIDVGRLDYLKSVGFKVTTACRYIDERVTPENLVLLASSS
jgi:hypothetical protein